MKKNHRVKLSSHTGSAGVPPASSLIKNHKAKDIREKLLLPTGTAGVPPALKFALLLSLLLLSSSCQMFRPSDQIALSRHADMQLSPAHSLKKTVFATQRVSIQKNGKKHEYLVQVDVDNKRIVLVGLSPMGTRAFSLTYENGELNYQKMPFIKVPIDAKKLLAHIQLAYWPLASMQQSLIGKELQLEENSTARRLLYKGKEIIRISPAEQWAGKTLIHYTSNDYQCQLSTLELEFN